MRELDYQLALNHRSGGRRGFRKPFPTRGSRLHPRVAQFRVPLLVVRLTGHEGRHLRLRLAIQSCIAQTTHCFEPTEYFLGPFSLALTDSLALGAGGAPIQSGCSAAIDSRNVRTDAMLTQVGDDCLDVIALVGRERFGLNSPTTRTREHRTGRAVFRFGRFSHQNIDTQPIAALHEHMPAVAKLGRLTVTFSHESSFWGGRALVLGVRAPLPLEIDHPVAVIATFRRLPILSFEAIERGQRADERSINSEMIRGQEMVSTGKADHFIKETPRNVRDHQALAQSAEVRQLQAGALEIHVKKPAKDNVEIQLLAELAVRADQV